MVVKHPVYWFCFFQDSDGIDLSTRDNTVSFMLDLSRHCGFHSETYSLSVNLLDRLLSVVKVSKLGLKLVFILGQILGPVVQSLIKLIPGWHKF